MIASLFRRRGRTLFLAGLIPALLAGAEQPAPSRPRTDANGNSLRYANTGHVSNYDEAKVGRYTLPELLVLQDGQPVRDAAMWTKQRRAELIALYENEIFGRVPEWAPRVAWTIAGIEPDALGGAATRTRAIATFTPVDGEASRAIAVPLSLYLPKQAHGPVPVVLQLSFYSDSADPPTAAEAAKRPSWALPTETGPVADLLARGFGYAVLRYTDIQPDRTDSDAGGIRALAYAPGQTHPAPGEWGAISAWAWAASRVMDFLATQPAIDARRVALVGFSRLGKTVLWAGARDERFALIFAACSGEMGAALARRDYGETVDDMAQNFPWWFAGNFQKYAAHWNDLPVDAHAILALNAPRPVFLTAGTRDQWADPRGMFLAAVAAGPVYRLLGKTGLEATEMPPVETPLIAGSLGFYFHTGPHVVLPADWKVSLDFAEARLKPTR